MVETAITDGPMAFRAEMEVMLDLSPRFLQCVSLLCMPLAAVDLLSRLRRPSPEPTYQPGADIQHVTRGADVRANRSRINLPVTLLAGETEGEISLTLIAHISIDAGDRVILRH